eukprot:1150931-Pelagomonas_calceolata.AAC.4
MVYHHVRNGLKECVLVYRCAGNPKHKSAQRSCTLLVIAPKKALEPKHLCRQGASLPYGTNSVRAARHGLSTDNTPPPQ